MTTTPNLPHHMKWIEHQDSNILVTNYRNIPDIMLGDLIAQASRYVISLNDPNLLQLLDVEGTEGTRKAITAFSIGGKVTKGHFKKVAVIGMSKPKVMIVNSFKRLLGIQLSSFLSEKEALNWLVSD